MDETHRKLDDVEHCLLRPDMFIGSVLPQPTPYEAIVPAAAPAGDDTASTSTPPFTVEMRAATVCPALSQLFLEIATNATDHSARPNTNVRNIRVKMNEDTGEISVFNDGESIPVRMHKQLTDKWLTTVIFSEFRCGSNYNDDELRTGAGRNGYGAKCVMCWSKRAVVSHNDGAHEFSQTFYDNLSRMDPPLVSKSKRKTTYTEVKFLLDFERLGIADIKSAIDYLRSFVWHLAVVTDQKINVYLDDQKLPVRNLKDYARILSPDPREVVYDEGENIEVAVCPLRPGAPSFSIGFVNGIPCHSGTHVTYALTRVREIINSGKGAKACSAAALKGQITIFCNLRCYNPTFTSQTKEQLSLDMRKSGARWEPSVAFQRNLKKSSVALAVRLDQQLRDDHKAKISARSGSSARSKHVDVPDYEPANSAGRARREPTTLILTEGLSAKGFVVAGVPNRETFGIFPLRGKLRNVRGESLSTILKTVEIANLLKILGVDLCSKEPYTDTSRLRYDRVMITCDQDVDGAHITGLCINALYVVLPELMRSDAGFVQRLATPLVRAWPKRGVADEGKEFLTESDFEAWFGRLDAGKRARYEVKYYKGLGTSTAREAKAIFSNLDKYLVTIDCTRDEAVLADFFDAKLAEKRREYLRGHQVAAIDYTQATIPLSEYLMGEVLPFSRYDNERSIAHVVDGFKPAQRKIMWTMCTAYRDVATPTIKVAQLSGEVAKRTWYKHGEDSLNGTAMKMAADYPICGNNMNLLTPGGMYGNRHGDDPASPRYVFTCCEAIASYVFPESDFPVLDMLECEGHVIEPACMVPVLPIVLCNGTSGVGTGWSSDVPCFDPRTIIEWCRLYNARTVSGSPAPPLDPTPWIEGFRGKIGRVGDRFVATGMVEQVDERTLRITDLPMPTNAFLFSDKKKSDAKFKDEHPHRLTISSTDTTVNVLMQFDAPIADKTLKFLKSRACLSISLSNMHLWSVHGFAPHHYDTVLSIAEAHAEVRLLTYGKRREHQICELRNFIARISDEHRFVRRVIETKGSLVFMRAKADVVRDLESDGFAKIDGGYDHLLKLPFSSATAELLEKLKGDRVKAEAQLDALINTTVHDMWERELVELAAAYDEFLATRQQRRGSPTEAVRGGSVVSRRRPAGKIKGVPNAKKARALHKAQ